MLEIFCQNVPKKIEGNSSNLDLIAHIISNNAPMMTDYHIAKKLLEKFFSFSKIIKSSSDQLLKVDGLDFHHVLQLKAIYIQNCFIKRQPLLNISLTASNKDLHEYCLYLMSDLIYERLHVFYLTKDDFLIEDEVLESGYLESCPFDKKTLLSRLIQVGASGFILAHNHPSHDLTVSDQDLNLTKEISTSFEAFDLTLKGHLIVGKTECQLISY